MPLVQRNHEIQTLATCRADQTFAEGVRLWGAHRRLEDAKMHRRQRAVYGGGVDGVAVMNDEAVRFVASYDTPGTAEPSIRRSGVRSRSSGRAGGC